MATKVQERVITVPRGQNIGKTVIKDLESNLLYKRVDIKTIHTVRDVINKVNIVTLGFIILNS